MRNRFRTPSRAHGGAPTDSLIEFFDLLARKAYRSSDRSFDMSAFPSSGHTPSFGRGKT
jgi:hypothetical protein